MNDKPEFLQKEMNIPEEYIIDNAGKADWAIRVIKSEQAQCDEYIAACEYQINQLKDKINERKERLENQTSNLLNMLREYLRTAPTKKAKASESLELPSGKIRLTYASQKMKPDDVTLINALQGTDFVQTSYKLKWGEYKKKLTIIDGIVVNTETGEQIDGVEIIEGEERVKVE